MGLKSRSGASAVAGIVQPPINIRAPCAGGVVNDEFRKDLPSLSFASRSAPASTSAFTTAGSGPGFLFSDVVSIWSRLPVLPTAGSKASTGCAGAELFGFAGGFTCC